MQSMEVGNANQASELGCRFLYPDGLCYINGALQLWCVTEGKGNVWRTVLKYPNPTPAWCHPFADPAKTPRSL